MLCKKHNTLCVSHWRENSEQAMLFQENHGIHPELDNTNLEKVRFSDCTANICIRQLDLQSTNKTANWTFHDGEISYQDYL